MVTAVVLPKQGQSVESAVLVKWHKREGDPISENEVLCEVETDKAVFEVPSPAAGNVLALFFREGDEIPVLTVIAAVGQPGEAISHLRPGTDAQPQSAQDRQRVDEQPTTESLKISPRARKLAQHMGIELSAIQGTGPGSRIIERDIRAALVVQPKMTPLARSMVASGDFASPDQGTGWRGRITSRDLQPIGSTPPEQAEPIASGPGLLTSADAEIIPLTGTRKVIATRMLQSAQTTAQLTLNTFGDARALLDYRKRLKASPAELGLQDVTLNDLLLFLVSRTLLNFPELNSWYAEGKLTRFKAIHLGFAVDTPRGLVVPVLRNAHTLSLKTLAQEAHRLAAQCLDGKIAPNDLRDGTFTVTNLGHLGIESFTPILNPPQVGILGVGGISLRPVQVDEEVVSYPHLGLSLTVDHQVVDGAPAARFLQSLTRNIAYLDLLLGV